MRVPMSARSPMISRILCRANSSAKRNGSLLRTASPRTTMAFSKLPPLIKFFLHQGRDFFVINKSAGGRDFAFVKSRRNLGGEKLGEAIVRSGLSTRNAKLVIGQEHKERTA